MELMNLSGASQTMSSLEIADLTGKRHDHVLQDIRRTLNEAGIEAPEFMGACKMPSGQLSTVYNLPRRECDLVVSGYSVSYRLAIIDRWHELEKPKPKTALQLAREQVFLLETIETQALQLAAQAPAVAFVEKFVEARSSKCLSDVAKILGKKPQAFIQQLAEDHVIFKRVGNWLPAQNRIDNGQFTIKTGTASGHAFEQTRVEPKGIEWMARVYG